jgi:hypothetical protein
MSESENVVPFAGGPAWDVIDAATRANLFRLDVIEAARTLEKAAEAGLLADVKNPSGIQFVLLAQVIDAVDLVGLEYLNEQVRPGSIVGSTIVGVEKEPENQAPFDVVVRLSSGEGIPMPEFVLTLRHAGDFLRLPDSIVRGSDATIEALRDRLGGGIPS